MTGAKPLAFALFRCFPLVFRSSVFRLVSAEIDEIPQ